MCCLLRGFVRFFLFCFVLMKGGWVSARAGLGGPSIVRLEVSYSKLC